MPYKLKNKFLIIGLTGPVGSGCTTMASFLSGRGRGLNLKKLISKQVSRNEVVGNKIKDAYKNLSKTKTSIEKLFEATSKIKDNLSLHAPSFYQDTVDKEIIEYDMVSRKNHHDLKLYLQDREIIKVLRRYNQDQLFKYSNLNNMDKLLFGFQPFIYLSFTSFIVKLALERYWQNNGKEQFDQYIDKIENLNSDFKNVIGVIKQMIIQNFEDIHDVNWKSYEWANKIIKKRIYDILSRLDDSFTDHYGREFDQNIILRHNEMIRKISMGYYEYMNRINCALRNIKNPPAELNCSINEASFHHVLSRILQDWGDNIRKTGNPFSDTIDANVSDQESLYTICNEINLSVKFLRYRIRYLNSNFEAFSNKDKLHSLPAVFVVECFRNPYEIDFFRSRYAEFYLISLSATKPVRKARVKFFSEDRDERDRGEDRKPNDKHKLDVRSCVLLSDISIINNHKKLVYLYSKTLRYLALIREPGCVPPSDNEMYMHIAFSHSLKSTCISHQVGAVVIGPKGYIYGAGWNDVSEGQIGCGYREKNDFIDIVEIPVVSTKFLKENFLEAIKEKDWDYVCYKDIMSKLYVDEKSRMMNMPEECRKLNIKRLEYCRALHAEENALLQTSKVGGMPLEGGTIYTTLYPCELCAKKLYQTGIRTVYYTEPYPESISEEVFFEDGRRKIKSIPFEGVKSYSYYKLFKPIYDKKELQIMFKQ